MRWCADVRDDFMRLRGFFAGFTLYMQSAGFEVEESDLHNPAENFVELILCDKARQRVHVNLSASREDFGEPMSVLWLTMFSSEKLDSLLGVEIRRGLQGAVGSIQPEQKANPENAGHLRYQCNWHIH